KVVEMIQHLYDYYKKNVDKLPAEYSKFIDEDGIDRVVCDYIACMTDRYALTKYEELFIPKVWQYK
ncbi:MAG: deoxyguanosinetriphosphate triphosphohydrolase, partial [Clostridia bacterium]|nr:deoxyguanosinetriphosphate triphosphohydrolase [Clostridia bacterium]